MNRKLIVSVNELELHFVCDLLFYIEVKEVKEIYTSPFVIKRVLRILTRYCFQNSDDTHELARYMLSATLNCREHFNSVQRSQDRTVDELGCLSIYKQRMQWLQQLRDDSRVKNEVVDTTSTFHL